MNHIEGNFDRKPRKMTKSELAMLYSPHATRRGALSNLSYWMRRNPDLLCALQETGYQVTNKTLLPCQVGLIFAFLGEP